MTTLRPHHAAWLEAHPYRSAEWLQARVADGFDVHHLDGNPENNEAANLVLIEHGDHMALHNGGTVTLGRLMRRAGTRHKRKARAYAHYEATQAALVAGLGVSE